MEGIEGAVNATRSLTVVVESIVAAAAEVVVPAIGVGDGATDALTRRWCDRCPDPRVITQRWCDMEPASWVAGKGPMKMRGA